MTTLLNILDFVKGEARITATDQDAQLKRRINYSYQRYCRRFIGPTMCPALRTEATFTTTSAQSYVLESNFDVIYENGVRYDTDNANAYGYQKLEHVTGSNAELYRQFGSQLYPVAFQIIAGATGATRKMQLLPTFTETGKVVTYTYQRKITDLAADADVLLFPELAEAICFDVLSLDKDFLRDNDNAQQDYQQRARRAYLDARATVPQ